MGRSSLGVGEGLGWTIVGGVLLGVAILALGYVLWGVLIIIEIISNNLVIFVLLLILAIIVVFEAFVRIGRRNGLGEGEESVSQTGYTTLYQLANQAEVGDEIRWKGKKSNLKKPKPRTVTSVQHEAETSTIEAEGPRGGMYEFTVNEKGGSEAWFLVPDNGKRSQGPVDKAELVEKRISTEPWDYWIRA